MTSRRSRRTVRSALWSLSFVACVACGDDDKRRRDEDESLATTDAASPDGSAGATVGDAAQRDAATARDGAVATDGAAADIDSATLDNDASGRDSATAPSDSDGATGADTEDAAANGSGGQTGGDGGAVAEGDAASSAPDAGASAAEPDAGSASVGDASTGGATPGDAATDAEVASGDAAASSDAAVGSDAAASSDAGASSDAARCDVTDSRFGCGVQRGSLVEFANGYTVDRDTRLAWGPVVDPLSDNDQSVGCGSATFDGVDEFALPTIDQVRTLAAGCDARCELATDSCTGRRCNEACESEAARSCGEGEGRHASGGYCRPELTLCEPMFTRDACDIGSMSDCTVHQHWYYDPQSGIFRLVRAGQQVAGRCVARITGDLP
jgi:hypothetical protein